MFWNMFKFLIIIGFLILQNSLTDGQIQRALCSQSPSMTFNASQVCKTFMNPIDSSINSYLTQISGIWWEVARSPAKLNLACVKVQFTEIQTENTLEIATTYATSYTDLWKNQTVYANISLTNNNANGFNISYSNGLTTPTTTTYKLLDTDYNNYALICGYTNAINNETSFGIVMTRQRFPNVTYLLDLEDAASLKYIDFEFGTMPLVTQSPA